MGIPDYQIPTARWLVQNLIDLEAVVDDRRQELTRASDALFVAVRERDRIARWLTHLLKHYEVQ